MVIRTVEMCICAQRMYLYESEGFGNFLCTTNFKYEPVAVAKVRGAQTTFL